MYNISVDYLRKEVTMDEENKIDQPIEDNPSSEQEQPVDDASKTEREVADIDTSDDCEKEDMTAEAYKAELAEKKVKVKVKK
jgi:hypothetical protein